MIKHSESRFQFGAEGVAIGGYLDRPVDELIESQAATALPPTGADTDPRGWRTSGIAS